MYGKFFAHAFSGSMYGAGANVFALWGYVIANTINSRVEINPVRVAAEIGMPTESLYAALEYLCKPDPESRCKDFEGRRMVKEGQFQYFIPSHESYRNIRKSTDLTEYNRKAKQKEREKHKMLGAAMTLEERNAIEARNEHEGPGIPPIPKASEIPPPKQCEEPLEEGGEE